MSNFLEILHQESQGLPLPYLKWLKKKLVKFGRLHDHPNEVANKFLYPLMRPNHCQGNSLLAAQSLKHTGQFVEGFHYDKTDGVMIFHCWNTIDGDRIVDYTRHFWIGPPAPDEEEYWGVALPYEFIQRYAMRDKTWHHKFCPGLLDTPLAFKFFQETTIQPI